MGNELKAGVKTSEFWVIITIILLVAFGKKLGVDMTPELVNQLLVLGGIYVGGRTAPKVAALLRSSS